MVSKLTEGLLSVDRQYVMHPGYVVGQNSGIVFEKAHGIYLVDTEGKEYIDLASGNCCVNLGHGRKEIIDAVTEAITKTDFTTLAWGHSNPYIIQCSQRLANLTPGTLKHFFYTNSGSEAVEAAIKFARSYWYYQGLAGKHKIVSLYDSFHGRAAGFALYATGMGHGELQKPFGPGMVGFIHIPSYYCYRCMFGLTYPKCDLRCARMLEDIFRAEGAESIAAFIAEPMLGGGGFVAPPVEWWPIVSEICQKYEVLLIADEVLTGFARTGKMFGVENWHIQPDIMTMAKGISSAYLPFSATAISAQIYRVLEDKTFVLGGTYSGHAVCAAAACAALDIYVRDKVVENAAKVGSHIKQRLDAEFSTLHRVGNIGGMGINYGVELVDDKRSKTPIKLVTKVELSRKLLENGIYTRMLGRLGNRLHIGPPCVSTIREVDMALDIVHRIIAELNSR